MNKVAPDDFFPSNTRNGGCRKRRESEAGLKSSNQPVPRAPQAAQASAIGRSHVHLGRGLALAKRLRLARL